MPAGRDTQQLRPVSRDATAYGRAGFVGAAATATLTIAIVLKPVTQQHDSTRADDRDR
jgi:negative regulator of sigma E activity